MLTPVGSLPPTVYWKRRLAAAAAVVVVIVVLFLIFGRGNASSASGTNAAVGAQVAAGTPQLQLVPTPLNTTSPTTTTPSGSQSASGTTATTTATSGATATVTTPAQPVACGDEMLGLTVAPQSPSYSVNDKPTLLVSVTNISAAACLRDLGGVNLEFSLYSGTTRVWGSNDCYPSTLADVQTLQPAQALQRSVVWSGQTSDPGCTAERTRLAPGSYTLRAAVGAAVSPDAVLALTWAPH